MLRTRFTDLVGCSIPIQQAGMGVLSNPSLAAAVADAGGLGMISWGGMPAAYLTAQLDQARLRTDGVVGVNFLIPALERDRGVIYAAVDAVAPTAHVIDFFWYEPDAPLIERARAGGALVAWQVGSRDEAVKAADAGCDFLIVQGTEAGSHIRGRAGVLNILDRVLDAVDVPVLAAGGIGSGRSLAAVLAAGADGARVGTRFVAAEEARAHPHYVRALVEAEAEDTVYTTAFSYGWPDSPHRCLRSCVEAAGAFEGEIVGERFSLYSHERAPVHRFQSVVVSADTTGKIEAMSLWAGESVSSVKRVQPAGNIVREMAGQAEKLLRRWA